MEKRKFFTFSIGPQSLNYKLRIAFYLMSNLPLVITIYIILDYVFPQSGLNLDVRILILILITIFVSNIGFFMVKKIFDHIISIGKKAELIAEGNVSQPIEIGGEDELSGLAVALNKLTQNIRQNMEELKSYSQKTKELDREIQKRVFVFSSLLQIGSLISHGAKLEDILKAAIEKLRILNNSDTTYLFLKHEDADSFYIKASDGTNIRDLSKVNIDTEDSVFYKPIKTGKPLIVDKENKLPRDLSIAFFEKFQLNSTAALPVCLKGKVIGILGIGNTQESFSYTNDDIELLDIFAKQIAVALENDVLMHKVEKLEINDALTGLYNEMFIRNRLQEEIRRAIIYRRPCAFVLFDIDNFQKFQNNFGTLESNAVLKRVAMLLKDSVTEIDRIARITNDEFAIVLPERNKRQAQEIAEEIRKKIEFIFSEEQDINRRITVSGGVSENPLDGIKAEELMTKAKEALNFAKNQGRNRIIGFTGKHICQ